MFFKPKKNHYNETARLLMEQGYSDEYMAALETAIGTAKKAKDIAEGNVYKACALLFRGDLDNAYYAFAATDTEKIPYLIMQSYAANYLLCMFLLNKFREADELYVTFNDDLLRDKNILMRRTVGIHQFIAGNYDAALTVFIKAAKEAAKMRSSSSTVLMLDICTVRTLMKLDMRKEAAAYSDTLVYYENESQLGELVRRLLRSVKDKEKSGKSRK